MLPEWILVVSSLLAWLAVLALATIVSQLARRLQLLQQQVSGIATQEHVRESLGQPVPPARARWPRVRSADPRRAPGGTSGRCRSQPALPTVRSFWGTTRSSGGVSRRASYPAGPRRTGARSSGRSCTPASARRRGSAGCTRPLELPEPRVRRRAWSPAGTRGPPERRGSTGDRQHAPAAHGQYGGKAMMLLLLPLALASGCSALWSP